MQQKSLPEQALYFGAFFFGYYGFVGVFMPYVSLYLSDMGMTAVQIGILMSMGQAMRIVGPNLWGWVADHTQRRARVLQFTALGGLLSFIGVFFGQTFVQFLLVMMFLNMFTSAQGPLSEALMLTNMKGDLTYYGKLRLWGSIGYIVVVMGAGWVIDWGGIGLMPWIAVAVLGFVFFISTRFKEPEQEKKQSEKTSMAALILRKEIVAFLTSACLMIAAHMSVYVFLSLYLKDLGYSSTVIGIMWSIGVVAEIIFFYYQAPIFKKYGVPMLWLLSLLVAVVRFMLIGFGAESFFILLFAQILHGVTFGTHHAATVTTLQRWFSGPLQARGQALLISMSYGMGGMLGGLILSNVWDQFGPSVVYLVASGFALCGFVSASLSLRWQRQRDSA